MAAHPQLAPADHEDEPVLVREGVTIEEYLAMPETTQPSNLIEGRLYMSPAPLMRHQQIVMRLGFLMDQFARVHGGLAFISPMDCHLPTGSVLQPDVGYIAPERLDIVDRWVMGAPDLVIEVLSPGTRRFDRNRKLRAYETAGVREAWLVDPSSSTVIVFTGEGNQWVREHSVLFGEPIPSAIVDTGTAGLEEFV
jgi:Uma2 family endonuclease